MPSFCVVSTCEFKYASSENVSFHKFPQNSSELRAKWIKFADRGSNWKPSRWSSICSRHFLPSDFRDLVTRKRLKSNAVPSVTVKQFVGNFLDMQRKAEIIDDAPYAECRLCGIFCKEIESFATNFQILSMIQKCFPTLNVQQDDCLPKNLCSTCLEKLNTFSMFIDTVLLTQRYFETKFNTTVSTDMKTVNEGRFLNIKQEPVIKVKQEHNDDIYNLLNEDLDSSILEDHVEEKSQVFELPLMNSQEIVNNCDIMEIINLDDAFIDIPDDEGVDNSTSIENKVNCFEQKMVFGVADEHNYAKPPEPEPEIQNCKVERTSCKTEIQEDIKPKPVFVQPAKPNLDIVVIDDSILMPVPPEQTLLECKVCHLTFLSTDDIECHMKLVHTPIGKSATCTLCDQKFNSIYEYLIHKSKVHRTRKRGTSSFKSKWSCPMCGKVFLRKLALNNHRKYICEHQNGQCRICGQIFSQWVNLSRHEKLCKKRLKARNTIKKQPTQPKRPKVQANENGLFMCTLCDRTYTRRHNLFKHQSQHRPPEEWNCKCGDCGILFDHLRDLRRHLKHNLCLKASHVPEIKFVCTVCGKQFKTLQRLKFHLTTHSNKRPCVCETCGKEFRSVNNLYQHKITHLDVRKHKCDMCDKIFKRRGGLNQHKKAFHLKLRPHECPVCKHKFALKGDMQRCKHSALKEVHYSKNFTLCTDINMF